MRIVFWPGWSQILQSLKLHNFGVYFLKKVIDNYKYKIKYKNLKGVY